MRLISFFPKIRQNDLDKKKKKETSPERGRKTRGETQEALEMKTELFEVGVFLI